MAVVIYVTAAIFILKTLSPTLNVLRGTYIFPILKI
jgi:hypothetical protein